MARNDGVDRTVVRNVNLTKSEIMNAQHHNEREKSSYVNPDIIPERMRMNVHFKKPEGSYEEMFEQMKKAGVISTRGLKEDAKVYGELIFDVNSAHFHNNGGYEFAKKYYEEAYRAAVKIVGGEQYILSAVLHADERNKAMSEALGIDVYQYHMHAVYVPVVEKQVLWTKRCKDPALVGTVKETIMQVSSSKKWESKPAIDENGEPILQKNGKAVLRKSYSVLQDDYYNHMREAGYTNLERGERGSTEEHLTVTQFKVEKEQKRLRELRAAGKRVENDIMNYRAVADDARERVSEAQQRLGELTPIMEEAEYVADNFARTPEAYFPEASTFEMAKTYRENKAIPVFRRIAEVFLSLYQRYVDLINNYWDLESKYKDASKRCETLSRRNQELTKENEKLMTVDRMFRHVQQFFGQDKIAEAIEIGMKKEAENRKQQRKGYDR